MATDDTQAAQPSSRIEGGIEWYALHDPDDMDAQCARCGSSVESIDCGRCGGEGGYFGEDIASSYDYGWIDEDAWYTCELCRGRRHWLHCISSPEYCEANPMPGREHIVSTALKAEAWHD